MSGDSKQFRQQSDQGYHYGLLDRDHFLNPRTQEACAKFIEEGGPDQCTKSNSCKSNITIFRKMRLSRVSEIIAHQFCVHAISVSLLSAFRLVLYV
jgi:hypothetical protein